MPIEFKLDPDKAREALVYLALKSTSFDIYKACKLLFLADKYHLVRYGRTITGDWYFAMPHGPAPNRIYGQLNMMIDDPDNMPALSSVLNVDRSFQAPRFVATRRLEFENLSKSDLEALDETVRRFDSKTFEELKILTHGMVAYRKAWRKRGAAKSHRMAFEDFFEEDSDVIAGVLEGAIEDSDLRRAFPGH
jgi:hypothetical protein